MNGSAHSSACRRTIDCHLHLRRLDDLANLVRIAGAARFDRVNIVCISGRGANESAFVAKAEHPDLFYFFGGLDHTARLSGGRVRTPSLAEQVDRLTALGADGIKMLETKPTFRKSFDVPVDSDYFDEYFAHLEETGRPVIWHVNDPEEFWDAEKIPSWAREHGWLYDGTFVDKETLYAEVERVLKRHPRLRVIFAHFYFLSADLPRAERFMEAHPSVSFDITPGIEQLYNMSGEPDASRDFFVRFSDRILFGTDISSGQKVDGTVDWAGMVRRWLETGDTFRESADYGVLRGLALPDDVLEKIYRGNFERLAGPEPKPLDKDLARAECERIAEEMDALGRLDGLDPAVAERAGPGAEHARRAAGRL